MSPHAGYLSKIRNVGQMGGAAYKGDSNVIGSGGHYIFSFRAKTKGKTDLRWFYLRPFEKEVVPAKSFEVQVIVQNNDVCDEGKGND